uniref:E3 ubiquitin-protein ligase PPP1R11 n=1 Tax=Ixodes ricinus TaxID=34613 RepID=A0A0K8RJC4_IXORI
MHRSGTVTLLLQPQPAPAREDASPSLENSLSVLTVRETRRVRWQEGTVDNEGLHRKSSKCCCIFNKRRNYDDDYSDDDSYEIKVKNAPKGHHKGCFSHNK